ncbi:hypothetical protein DAMNIGENAA_08450 [Desulforhabdus amnigena]|uniref:Uncharacterized protein n=1 Tax=Desulforhabdus amnigena TaxID=40218 RepID=A0A9W6CZW7_9BACT|nr:hypothetical protein DAMNIGENAA_08450 [Desulforhabdus amnigena]
MLSIILKKKSSECLFEKSLMMAIYYNTTDYTYFAIFISVKYSHNRIKEIFCKDCIII